MKFLVKLHQIKKTTKTKLIELVCFLNDCFEWRLQSLENAYSTFCVALLPNDWIGITVHLSITVNMQQLNCLRLQSQHLSKLKSVTIHLSNKSENCVSLAVFVCSTVLDLSESFTKTFPIIQHLIWYHAHPKMLVGSCNGLMSIQANNFAPILF